MIYGAMLAGGSGTRVKSSKIPKQFIEIGGKPIIIYTLENMLKVKRFDYIYIAVHKDYEDYMNEQVKKNIPESEKVRVILGGKERMEEKTASFPFLPQECRSTTALPKNLLEINAKVNCHHDCSADAKYPNTKHWHRRLAQLPHRQRVHVLRLEPIDRQH